jgi:hypothetical protein
LVDDTLSMFENVAALKENDEVGELLRIESMLVPAFPGLFP